jgi:hypothetical protein
MSEVQVLRTAVTNQNLIQEKIKRILHSGNVLYHSVQDLLSSRLLSKNIKIRMYDTIILLLVSFSGVFCRENNMKHINALSGLNYKFLMLNADVTYNIIVF